jgi:hypothetical protein
MSKQDGWNRHCKPSTKDAKDTKGYDQEIGVAFPFVNYRPLLCVSTMVRYAKSPQGIRGGDIRGQRVGSHGLCSFYLFFIKAVNPPLLQDRMRSSWERRRPPEGGSPPTNSGNSRTKRKEFFFSEN